MKNIKITTCSIVYDANTVPYIERINYSGSKDYLVLTESDNIWFTDNRMPSVFASGMQADFSIGKKGPNLTSYKIGDMLPEIDNFLINYNHHWWFIHGKFHIENYPDKLMTTREPAVYYPYKGVPVREFMSIVTGPVRKIEPRIWNGITKKALEDLE